MTTGATRTALITGAGKNIGRAIAQTLASDGYHVVVNGRSDHDAINDVVSTIRAAGGSAEGVIADVSQPDDVERMINQVVSANRGIDVLVSNAGLRRQTPFLDMSFSEWREILSVALDGAFLLTRAAVPHMLGRGSGAIVALSGVSTHIGTPNRCHVSASKAGLEGFVRALAIELASHDITCNCIAPGAIDTVRGAAAGAAPPRLASAEAIPMGRKGDVDDIASMVRYLAGPNARYVTGQTLHINGGVFLS
ncbi:MAG: SDR family NAD(P)-dependent oxidoreductase [Pseudomonadota bacterium]